MPPEKIDSPNRHHPKITIGISRCLLGDNVRYDGKHKRNKTICSILSPLFTFQSFCPEVAIGLGVPRPPIQLVQSIQQKTKTIRIVEVNNKNNDYTDSLQQYARHIACTELVDSTICGFIFKKNSPSCGMSNVKVYNLEGQLLHQDGIGLFAYTIKQQYPQLPIEDEENLSNLTLREKFIARVYAYHNKQIVFDN
jgi:uncharacterized protein YbbK (DUF523 family)